MFSAVFWFMEREKTGKMNRTTFLLVRKKKDVDNSFSFVFFNL